MARKGWRRPARRRHYAVVGARLIDDRGDRDLNAAELPIACTLEAREGAERLIRWKALVESSVLELKREPDVIVVCVAKAAGIAAELDTLVAAERACCPFVDWRLVEHERWHELQIHGTEDGLDAIAGLFHSR
jgi:hypothetical protein